MLYTHIRKIYVNRMCVFLFALNRLSGLPSRRILGPADLRAVQIVEGIPLVFLPARIPLRQRPPSFFWYIATFPFLCLAFRTE